jgi:hypothetical protein
LPPSASPVAILFDGGIAILLLFVVAGVSTLGIDHDSGWECICGPVSGHHCHLVLFCYYKSKPYKKYNLDESNTKQSTYKKT